MQVLRLQTLQQRIKWFSENPFQLFVNINTFPARSSNSKPSNPFCFIRSSFSARFCFFFSWIFFNLKYGKVDSYMDLYRICTRFVLDVTARITKPVEKIEENKVFLPPDPSFRCLPLYLPWPRRWSKAKLRWLSIKWVFSCLATSIILTN